MKYLPIILFAFLWAAFSVYASYLAWGYKVAFPIGGFFLGAFIYVFYLWYKLTR